MLLEIDRGREEKLDRICQRVQASQLLLDFYRRAMKDRRYRQATKALQYRIRLLRALREKRGYEE
jgi:hypothetical protein